MKKQVPLFLSVMLITGLLAVCLGACGSGSGSAGSSNSNDGTSSTTPTIDSAQAQQILESACTRCHALNRVTSKTKTASEWKSTIDRMVRRGASLTSDQEQLLVEYLALNY